MILVDVVARITRITQGHSHTFFHVLSIFAYTDLDEQHKKKRSLGAYMSPGMATKEAFWDSLSYTATVGTSLVYGFDIKTGRKRTVVHSGRNHKDLIK